MKRALTAFLDPWLNMLALLSIAWGPLLYQQVGDSKWPAVMVWGLVICGSNFAGFLRGFYEGRGG